MTWENLSVPHQAIEMLLDYSQVNKDKKKRKKRPSLDVVPVEEELDKVNGSEEVFRMRSHTWDGGLGG